MQWLRMCLSHRSCWLQLHHVLRVQGNPKPSETSGCLVCAVFSLGWCCIFENMVIQIYCMCPCVMMTDLVFPPPVIALLSPCRKEKPALVVWCVWQTQCFPSWADGHRNSWPWTVTQCILISWEHHSQPRLTYISYIPGPMYLTEFSSAHILIFISHSVTLYILQNFISELAILFFSLKKQVKASNFCSWTSAWSVYLV